MPAVLEAPPAATKNAAALAVGRGRRQLQLRRSDHDVAVGVDLDVAARPAALLAVARGLGPDVPSTRRAPGVDA